LLALARNTVGPRSGHADKNLITMTPGVLLGLPDPNASSPVNDVGWHADRGRPVGRTVIDVMRMIAALVHDRANVPTAAQPPDDPPT
jgi:hypothetical protein